MAERPSRHERAAEDTARIVRERPGPVVVWGAGVAGAASGFLPTDITGAGQIVPGFAIGFGIAGMAAGLLLVLVSIYAWTFLTARRHQLADRVDELQDEVRELSTMVKPEP